MLELHCNRCGERLDPDKAVWLELDQRDNRFVAIPESGSAVPQERSQGCFPFGAACASRVLKAGGELTRVGKARG